MDDATTKPVLPIVASDKGITASQALDAVQFMMDERIAASNAILPTLKMGSSLRTQEITYAATLQECIGRLEAMTDAFQVNAHDALRQFTAILAFEAAKAARAYVAKLAPVGDSTNYTDLHAALGRSMALQELLRFAWLAVASINAVNV